MSWTRNWPTSPGGWLGPAAETHVNNQYHEAVWANVSVDHAYVKSVETEIGLKMEKIKLTGKEKVEYFWKLASKNGFTKVAPKSALSFKPGNGTVYISIYKSDGEPICASFPRAQNESVMVDSDGYVRGGYHGDNKRGN